MYLITGTNELSKQSAQPLFFYKPNMDDMNYILKIKDQNISVPLSEPMKFRNLKEFDSTHPTIVMITGWTTNVNKPVNHALDLIYAAYRCRGNVNFLVNNILKYFCCSIFLCLYFSSFFISTRPLIQVRIIIPFRLFFFSLNFKYVDCILNF